jgi:hypothetical protein
MPIANTRPNIVSVLIEKPSIGKKMNVPTSATGTVSSGMIVARKLWRKTNTTILTRMNASISVWMIDSMLASTEGVVSYTILYATSVGKNVANSSSASYTPSAEASWFAPGRRYTSSDAAAPPAHWPVESFTIARPNER